MGKHTTLNQQQSRTMTTPTPPKITKTTTTLTALGFCGVDDSVHPNLLAILAHAFPLVEFGVLFRPDLAGQPRYASDAWVTRLCRVANKMGPGRMKLAAHLCGSRVNQVLQGDDSFLQQLTGQQQQQQQGSYYYYGSCFGRVQINATAVNGVDTSNLKRAVPVLAAMFEKYAASLEFIIQQNQETKPLWQGLLDYYSNNMNNKGDTAIFPKNVSMLVDESKGTGVTASSWPSPPIEYDIGYAGGIGPDNIRTILQQVDQAAQGRAAWIDMETSLRSIKNGQDVFDIDKCYKVIEATCDLGFMSRPEYLE